MIGADFHCHLVQYMRTIVYQIPVLKVGESKPAACIILEEPEFRASVVVEPFAYLRDEGISDQFEFEDNIQLALDQACPQPGRDSEAPLYLVIQFKENLNSFAAVDGQCRRICVDGVERFGLVECGEPYTPNPNERKRTIQRRSDSSAGRVWRNRRNGTVLQHPLLQDGRWAVRSPVESRVQRTHGPINKTNRGHGSGGQGNRRWSACRTDRKEYPNIVQRCPDRPWPRLQCMSRGTDRSDATRRDKGSCVLEALVLATLRPARKVRGAVSAEISTGESKKH